MKRTDAERLARSALGDAMVELGDIAEHLRVHLGTIKRWRSQGKLPPADFEFGGVVRWHQQTITKWIERNRGS